MSLANIRIHESQFPAAVRRDLWRCLRARQVNHKFHYDSYKQTHKWLALHQKLSPSRADKDCAATYDQGIDGLCHRISGGEVHLIGLGCGGGQKDTRILKALAAKGSVPYYTPVDVSTPMVIVARESALRVIPEARCFPLVCDLATAADLSTSLRGHAPREAPRIFSFFGMIPNFEPARILPTLRSILQRGDSLLLSANLAPGSDYQSGIRKVLPQYDNPLTRDWLMTFLLDLGVNHSDGALEFRIEFRSGGLGRIAAYFSFRKDRTIGLDARAFSFRRGQSIRLFFSCRYTPVSLRAALSRHGIAIMDQWLAASGEEGVFLAKQE